MSFDFVTSILTSEISCINYLMNMNILRSKNPLCSICKKEMSIIKYRNSKIYRCPKHKTVKISLKKGTFLENSNLSFQMLVKICYAWSTNRPVFRAVEEFSLQEKSVIKWYQHFRDVCSRNLILNEYKIGGVGHIVQIDETLISKAKYNVGRWPKQR